MIRINKILLFIILTISIQVNVFAQTKIQIVTRTIQKSFECKPSFTLEINAEKAKIHIKKSTNNKINIVLSLISKNPSLKNAEADLKYCDYQIAENNVGINISNFFNIKNNYKEITSNLSARMEIEVPAGINIKLKDIYGDVDMNEIDGIFNIVADFGSVKFSEISGNLYIGSNCSDINGNSSDAAVNITAQKADIDLNNINNMLTIKNKYGNIRLKNAKAGVEIDAELTAITIIVLEKESNYYSLDLVSKNGDIEISKPNSNYIMKRTVDSYLKTTGLIPMKIKTTYNIITLKTE